MKKTKEEAIKIAKKVLNDFENKTYFEETFNVLTPEENNKNNIDKLSFDFWIVNVNVPQEQFGGDNGVFWIYIKDETMEPFMFWDGGAPGRVPDLEIINKNGKYIIGNIWKNK